MPDINIILPSKPKVVSEKEHIGTYEIDSLYPGYGHTLGNSLRRIILSSLPGAAVTRVKIAGVSHEFSTIDGIKEDVITLLLNVKRLRFKLHGDEAQKGILKINKIGEIRGSDIKLPSQAELANGDLVLAHLTQKGVTFDMELTIEQGLGFVPKELLHKDKVEIGSIALDATFTPIRRVNYEVENMRVGDRTDFNRLKILIETDGVITPREALERSIEIMINQLKAVVGFREDATPESPVEMGKKNTTLSQDTSGIDPLKIRVEELELSPRTLHALVRGNVKTVGGILRKKEADLLELDGFGDKALGEIKRAVSQYGLTLKQE